MSEQDIQNEVNARVEFKMQELLTGVKNRAGHAWQSAFANNSPKHQHYWEAFRQLEDMVRKETAMATPRDDMYFARRDKKKDEVMRRLDEVYNRYLRGKMRGDDYHHFMQAMVELIQSAQSF